MQGKRLRWPVEVLALLAVAAFLILNLNRLHMHPDEELSYRSTPDGLIATLHYQTSLQDNQAPLWFLTFRLWRYWVGDAEFTSRVLGMLLSLLALAVLVRLVRRAYHQNGAAMFALLVLVGNGFFFNYALDIRPYPMVMLAAALCMWAFWRWLEDDRRAGLIYGLSLALLFYVHYLLVFLAAAQGLYVFVTRPRRLPRLILPGIVAALICLPWLPVFMSQVNFLKQVEAASGTGRGVAGIGVSTLPTTLPNIGALVMTMTNELPLLFAVLLVVGGALLLRERGFWLALTWALLTPALYLLANLVSSVYAPRFVSHLMLGLAFALGGTLAALPTFQRLRVGWLVLAGLVAAQLVTFPAQLPERVPYRDLFRQMSAQSHPGDAVLFVNGGEEDGFVQYLYHTWAAPSLVQGMTTDPGTAAQNRRVWFITGNWFADDVRAAFDQLEPSHPVQQVIGQCDRAWCYLIQLMEAPPQSTARLFGAGLGFYGHDLDAVTTAGIRTRLWWRVQAAPSLDYSISLRLLDSAGTLIAQSDGPIQHYGQTTIPTSQMQPGQLYIDHRTLLLPENLPTGEYRLTLVIYQPWDGQRLTLLDGRDELDLQTVSLPLP
jgi:MFS family permease